MAEFDSIRSTTRSDSNINIDSGLRAHMNKVYGLMAVAMVITGAVAWAISGLATTEDPTKAIAQMSNGTLVTALGSALYSSPLSWIVMLAPLGFVFFLSARVMKMSYSAGQLSFWLFSALMGLSLSTIFVVYTGASIANAFFTTAVAFGAMSLFGYTTKKDLSGMGRFLFMGVIGLIVAMIINWFTQSPGLEFAINVLGVLIFAGLTAYDTQNIKNTYLSIRNAPNGEEIAAKAGILGALSLYINFLNMFMFLLQFMGNRE